MKTYKLICSLAAILLTGMSAALGITFGELDGNAHPNVGMLLLWTANPNDDPIPLCSGTLIHERVFMTAGHCTAFVEAQVATGDFSFGNFFVTFDPNPYRVEAYRPVAVAFTHPGFRAGNIDNAAGGTPSRDLGLLVLEDAVPGITPATLAPVGFLDGLKRSGQLTRSTKFLVVGYGTTLTWPPPEIHFGDYRRMVAQSSYRALNASWLSLSQNAALGNGGTGYGDSGGPTFWRQPDGSEIIVSITSRGDPSLVSTGVAYRIDTADSLDFISGVINSLP